MKYKFWKAVIFSLQIILTLFLGTVCIYGAINTNNQTYVSKFIECEVRLVGILLFSIFYFSKMASGNGVDSLFFPLHLFFCTLTEFRICDEFCDLFFMHIIPPVESVNILIFSSLLTVLSLLGYCFFSNNPDSDNISRFLISSIAGSIIITNIIPKPQDVSLIYESKAFTFLISIIYIFSAFVCLVEIISGMSGHSIARYSIALILVIANFINLQFDTFLMNIIGTAFLFIVSVIIIIWTKRSAIKL